MRKVRKYGILVGGGPAPGIDSAIGAVAIEAIKRGHSVVGIYDGYRHLMNGQKNVEFLTLPKVSRIHLQGGSILRTSRANPTTDERFLRNTVDTLRDLEITHLVTIGGDDTAYSATRIAEYARSMGHKPALAHLPKTIDNDLPLPAGLPTFGFETARAEGSRMLTTCYQEARVNGRWFVVVAMGRRAGHLALGIGKAAGATLTLIPEEFMERISLKLIVDTIVGAILKRRAEGRQHGVALVAEGFLEFLDPEELEPFLQHFDTLERDEYGHLHLAELHFSDILKSAVRRRLEQLGIDLRIVNQELGYQLRCVDPCAFDVDYTRNLGYGAVEFLEGGGTNAMITLQGDRIVPIPFADLIDPETGRTRVRFVDVGSLSFRIAREYMVRLNRSDFDHPDRLRRLAATCRLEPERFVEEFSHVVTEPEPAGAVASLDG